MQFLAINVYFSSLTQFSVVLKLHTSYFCTSPHLMKRTQDKLIRPACIVKNNLDFCHYLPSSFLKLKYKAIYHFEAFSGRSLCGQQQVLERPCCVCGPQAWGETFAFLNSCQRQGMGAQGATVLMDFLSSALGRYFWTPAWEANVRSCGKMGVRSWPLGLFGHSFFPC